MLNRFLSAQELLHRFPVYYLLAQVKDFWPAATIFDPEVPPMASDCFQGVVILTDLTVRYVLSLWL